LYEGLTGSGWCYTVSGAPQQPGQPPPIYVVADNNNILLVQPGSPPKQVALQWPPGFTLGTSDEVRLLGSDGDGGLIITCGTKGAYANGRMFYVAPNTGHMQLLAGLALGSNSDAGNNDHPLPPNVLTDWVPGCGWGVAEVPQLQAFALDVNGDILYVVFSGRDVPPLVRISAGLKPPAHLQPTPLPPGPISIPTCTPTQLSSDLGTLLQSIQGADVELRCAGEEVVRAHSAILMARWEWFRAQAGMA
jgi:hypothetical protein